MECGFVGWEEKKVSIWKENRAGAGTVRESNGDTGTKMARTIKGEERSTKAHPSSAMDLDHRIKVILQFLVYFKHFWLEI